MDRIKHTFFQSVNHAIDTIEKQDFDVDYEDAADLIQVYFTL